MTTRTTEQLTTERGSTHGDYGQMSRVVMDIMRVYQSSLNWDSLPDTVQVFLFNNAQKCARILTGNPYERDHYDDVAGYASLAAESVAPPAEALEGGDAPDIGRLSADNIIVDGSIDADRLNLGTVDLSKVIVLPGGTTQTLGEILRNSQGYTATQGDVPRPITPLPAESAPTAQEGDTGLAPLTKTLPSGGTLLG